MTTTEIREALDKIFGTKDNCMGKAGCCLHYGDSEQTLMQLINKEKQELLERVQDQTRREIVEELNNLQMPLSIDPSQENYNKEAKYWNKKVKELVAKLKENSPQIRQSEEIEKDVTTDGENK